MRILITIASVISALACLGQEQQNQEQPTNTSASDWYTPSGGTWANTDSIGEFKCITYKGSDKEGYELFYDTLVVDNNGTINGKNWNDFINKQVEVEGGKMEDLIPNEYKISIEAAKNAALANVKIENLSNNLNNRLALEFTDEYGLSKKTKVTVLKSGETAASKISIKSYRVDNTDGLCKLKEGNDVVGSWLAGFLPDTKSITLLEDGKYSKLQIKGWHNPSAAASSIADEMVASSASDDNRLFVYRDQNGSLGYMRIGHIDTISTNDFNWVSNTLINVTNDMSSVQILTNCMWVTNWTDSVRNITNEETLKYISFVTNGYEYSTYMTNIWSAIINSTNEVPYAAFITNAYLHNSFVTNLFGHETFMTNIFDHETFMTNLLDHETFMTNMFSRETMLTNLFDNETFMTNLLDHETFMTNLFEHNMMMTNLLDHETFMTNMLSRETMLTNLFDHETFMTNLFDHETVLTNILANYTNDIFNVTNDLKAVTNTISTLTNALMEVLNNQRAFDQYSIWTNGERKVEMAGFHTVEKTEDYDFFPRATFGMKDGEMREYIAWDTNSMETIKRLLGIIIVPKKEILRTQVLHPQYINQYFEEDGIVQNIYGYNGVTNSPMSWLNSKNMLDNESVWTNGENKIEVKGFSDAAKKIGRGQIPSINAKGDGFDWIGLDSYIDTGVYYSMSTHYKSLCWYEDDELGILGDYKAMSLYGFPGAENRTIPVAISDGVGNKELVWRKANIAATKYVGTDGSEFVLGEAQFTNTVTFASSPDSNVSVNVAPDGNTGDIKITMGVYFK